MMIEFGIANQGDDAEIRSLLAANPMPGRINVAFEREPDYFSGSGVAGSRSLTLKAMDTATSRLAAVLTLASSRRFVGGCMQDVGYVGGARVDRRYNGVLIPLRAMPEIRRIVSQGWPSLWTTAIVNSNPVAEEIFIHRPRPSFPRLEAVSDFHTLGIFTKGMTNRRISRISGSLIELATAEAVGYGKIVEFLMAQGERREFFPCYSENDFNDGTRFPGLERRDVLVAISRGEIVGACAVWDQSSFKQAVVHGYSRGLSAFRPLVNSVGPMFGAKKLPALGEEIPNATLAALAVKDDNPAVFGDLLNAATDRAYRMGKDYLLAGFSNLDPLLVVARRRRHILYRSRMYAFGFEGPVRGAFDSGKTPYMEIAAL